MFRRIFYCALFLLAPSLHAQDQSEVWPEVDTYIKLTDRTRLFFNDQLSSDQDTRNLQGEFGANFDLFLRPFLRPKLRALDPAKSKLLTWRSGYRYLPTLRGDGPYENRIITELTGRFKFPLAILFSDRNRFDFRWVESKPFSWRYRNRVTLERNFTIHNYTFTPYLRGEFYWDSVYDKIDKNAFTIGSVFPMTKRTEFEVYYEDQRNSSIPPNYHTRGVGLCLSLYF
jgi:hypothetical protein